MPTEPTLGQSLWYQTARAAPSAPALEGEHQADVAIVGGGYTGCSAALHLARMGKSAIVLEAETFGWGGSGRNAGLVNAGLWLDPEEVVRRAGKLHGERLLDGLNAAPNLVFEIVDRYAIDCELVRKGVIKAAHNERGMRGLEEHARQWRTRGADIVLFDAAGAKQLLGTKRYVGGLIDHRSATIQPLSYARGLAEAAQSEGARLHAKTPVTSLERKNSEWLVSTPAATVRSEHVILATNVYSDELWPGVRESTIPVGAFFYATPPLGENIRATVLPAGHGMYDTQPVMTFARMDHDHRLLIGSLGYLPTSPPSAASAWVNRTVHRLFPQLDGTSWQHQWAGTIGFTPDHMPRLHEPAPNLYIVLGYNGRGIAPGTFWGKQLAERIGAGRPAADMALPVTPVRPIRGRTLWRAFYQSMFRAYRLR